MGAGEVKSLLQALQPISITVTDGVSSQTTTVAVLHAVPIRVERSTSPVSGTTESVDEPSGISHESPTPEDEVGQTLKHATSLSLHMVVVRLEHAADSASIQVLNGVSGIILPISPRGACPAMPKSEMASMADPTAFTAKGLR